jgi:hypothetical protein
VESGCSQGIAADQRERRGLARSAGAAGLAGADGLPAPGSPWHHALV